MQLRPATLQDARWMSKRLREEDAREVVTGTGMTPVDALTASLASTRHAYVATWRNRPVILYGVSACPVNARRGSVWLRATPEVIQISKSFLQASSSILEAFHEAFPEGLYALADSRNTVHLRWLLRAGFMLHEPVSVGGVPFYIATHV